MTSATARPLATPPDPVVIEFQERRRRTARQVRPWIIAAAAGLALLGSVLAFRGLFPEEWRAGLLFGGFLLAALSIAGINVVTSRHYRCPACGRMPVGSNGVLLDPTRCPACGVALKE